MKDAAILYGLDNQDVKNVLDIKSAMKKVTVKKMTAIGGGIRVKETVRNHTDSLVLISKQN